MNEKWRLYKKSKEWKALRALALNRADKQCEFSYDGIRCKCKTFLEMHHVKYPHSNFYGYFPSDCLENVRILCRSHHQAEHGGPCYVVVRPPTCTAKLKKD